MADEFEAKEESITGWGSGRGHRWYQDLEAYWGAKRFGRVYCCDRCGVTFLLRHGLGPDAEVCAAMKEDAIPVGCPRPQPRVGGPSSPTRPPNRG